MFNPLSNHLTFKKFVYTTFLSNDGNQNKIRKIFLSVCTTSQNKEFLLRRLAILWRLKNFLSRI